MPWGRLDDSLYDHPKLDLIPADERMAGIGLWAVAISWCNRFLTDGFVPTRQVERLGGTLGLADRLVVAGLFDEAEGGYLVHDFLDFNDAKSDVEERRRKEAERKAEWRRQRVSQRDMSQRDRPVSQRDTSNVPAGHRPPSRTMSQRDTNRTATVPAGHMSQRDSRARDVARDVARIPTRPDPTRPNKGSSSTGTVRARNGREPTLSKRELAAWSSFGPEWDGVKAAWLARGLRLPPAGDQVEGDEATQRAVLYQVLDARPTDVVRWIAEAPGTTSHDVIRHVLARWHEVRADASVDDVEAWTGPGRGEAAEALGEIMARVAR